MQHFYDSAVTPHAPFDDTQLDVLGLDVEDGALMTMLLEAELFADVALPPQVVPHGYGLHAPSPPSSEEAYPGSADVRARPKNKGNKVKGGLDCDLMPGKNARNAKLLRERKKQEVADLKAQVASLQAEKVAWLAEKALLLRQLAGAGGVAASPTTLPPPPPPFAASAAEVIARPVTANNTTTTSTRASSRTSAAALLPSALAPRLALSGATAADEPSPKRPCAPPVALSAALST